MKATLAEKDLEKILSELAVELRTISDGLVRLMAKLEERKARRVGGRGDA
jgi:hypothetical protein